MKLDDKEVAAATMEICRPSGTMSDRMPHLNRLLAERAELIAIAEAAQDALNHGAIVHGWRSRVESLVAAYFAAAPVPTK